MQEHIKVSPIWKRSTLGLLARELHGAFRQPVRDLPQGSPAPVNLLDPRPARLGEEVIHLAARGLDHRGADPDAQVAVALRLLAPEVVIDFPDELVERLQVSLLG